MSILKRTTELSSRGQWPQKNKRPESLATMTHIASVHLMKALRAEPCQSERGWLAPPVAELVLPGRARGAPLIYCCFFFHRGWLTECRGCVCVCVYVRMCVQEGFLYIAAGASGCVCVCVSCCVCCFKVNMSTWVHACVCVWRWIMLVIFRTYLYIFATAATAVTFRFFKSV